MIYLQAFDLCIEPVKRKPVYWKLGFSCVQEYGEVKVGREKSRV
jgi:hypothetical protein